MGAGPLDGPTFRCEGGKTVSVYERLDAQSIYVYCERATGESFPAIEQSDTRNKSVTRPCDKLTSEARH